MALADDSKKGEFSKSMTVVDSSQPRKLRRKLTPAEKKRLSYVRDCRGGYDANGKGRRKTVPRAKVAGHRQVRRAFNKNVALKTLADTEEVVGRQLDRVEDEVSWRVSRPFRKAPDRPLGVDLAYRMGLKASKRRSKRIHPEEFAMRRALRTGGLIELYRNLDEDD